MPRDTKQRRAINTTFVSAGRPLSPQEVLELSANQSPGLGLATVYRTIKRMLDDGTLTTVELPGLPDRYELSGKHHHHHFHCRTCGALFEVEGCPDDLGIDLPDGFDLEDHEIILYGRCRDCTTA